MLLLVYYCCGSTCSSYYRVVGLLSGTFYPRGYICYGLFLLALMHFICALRHNSSSLLAIQIHPSLRQLLDDYIPIVTYHH